MELKKILYIIFFNIRFPFIFINRYNNGMTAGTYKLKAKKCYREQFIKQPVATNASET